MGNSQGRKRIIISVGGSLIVPNGGIATEFLRKLNDFIREELAKDPKRQFFLVIGGGATARHYIDAGHDVVGHELTHDDMDWLGVHSTTLNAHLVRTIFRDIAHPKVIRHYDIIRKVYEPVVIASRLEAWLVQQTIVQFFFVKTTVAKQSLTSVIPNKCMIKIPKNFLTPNHLASFLGMKCALS